MAISEFDAFGPWIYKLDEEHPIPELFKPYVPEEKALLGMKLPRQIERRVATPDMQLYDYVVLVYEERLLILHRVDDSVEQLSVIYDDVRAIEMNCAFLNSHVTFFCGDTSCTIPFNIVSVKLIKQLIRMVGCRSFLKPHNKPFDLPQYDEAIDETLYVNLLRDMKEQGDNWRPCAFQHSREFRPKLLSRTHVLPGVLFLQNDHTVQVVYNKHFGRKQPESEYDYNILYMPYSSFLGAKSEPDSTYRDMSVHSITIPGHTFSYHTDEGNRSFSALFSELNQIGSQCG